MEIPLNNLKKSTNNLKVKFEMNKENDIVKADTPDEFFYVHTMLKKLIISMVHQSLKKIL
jgi:hypothetical protein